MYQGVGWDKSTPEDTNRGASTVCGFRCHNILVCGCKSEGGGLVGHCEGTVHLTPDLDTLIKLLLEKGNLLMWRARLFLPDFPARKQICNRFLHRRFRFIDKFSQ